MLAVQVGNDAKLWIYTGTETVNDVTAAQLIADDAVTQFATLVGVTAAELDGTENFGFV